MRKFISAIILAVFAACASQANADTNLVVNGGFETGDFTGWTLTGNINPITTSTIYGGYYSNYAAIFGAGPTLGYISQTIATTLGDQYDVSFWLDSDGGRPSEFNMSFNGNTLFDEFNLPYSYGYDQFSYIVTATGSSATLQFGYRDDSSALLLDDVSVVDEGPAVVPLPASVWGGGVLLAAMGVAALRRRKATAL